MNAKDLMSKKPEFLSPQGTLKQAANQMRSHDYGFIPVGENDRLVGVVTDRDLAIRAVAEGRDPNKTTVGDIMTKGVHFCFETDDLETVVHKMEEWKIRRLIVLDKNKRMTGIISLGDIAVKGKNPELCNELTDAVAHH